MCDRTDWPCVNDATHTAPRGCVHHATTDDIGSTRQPHADRDQSGDDQ